MLGRVVSALLAGIISGCGALLAVAMELPAGAEVSDIGSVTFMVIGCTAVINAAKDLQAYLKNPKGD